MANGSARQTDKLSTTSAQSPRLSIEQRKETARLLYAVAQAVGESLNEDRVDLYLQALADLPFEPLAECLKALIIESRWFPKIPDIREKVLGAAPEKKLTREAEAEAGWERVLHFADHWHPDIGALRGAPKLTERERRALTIIGGPEQVQNQFNGGQGMPFLHRDFLAAYGRLGLIEEPGTGLMEIAKWTAELVGRKETSLKVGS